jgi:hypothetical protein
MFRSMMRIALAIVIVGVGLLPARGQVAALAPAAIGDNALTLSGDRPPTGGGFDLSGYVEVPYAAALNPSGGALTIEAWVKRIATSRNESIVGNGWLTSYWFGFSGTGKLRFTGHGSGALVTGSATVPAGVWTHVAVTYNGTTTRFYINGILDASSAAGAGALVPAAAGSKLNIGRDPNDTFTPNYFGGGIDEVRMWNSARSLSDLKAGMFQSFGAPTPGLLAEWRFDGSASDLAGGHHGTTISAAAFSNDGALPHDIRIPQVSATPTVDGTCSEYASATKVTVGGAPVLLMHTASDLWICADYLADTISDLALYLDIDYSRLDPAQPDDLELAVLSTNTLRARAGNGAGGFVATTQADGQWSGNFKVCCGEFPSRRVEFRVSATLLGGWNHVIGLALAQHAPASTGDRWPALAADSLPSTWSSATLGGIGALRTFNGNVRYQPKNPAAAPTGVAGVKVRLIGSDPSGGEAVVAIDESNLDGSFSLLGQDDYARHRLELDTYTQPKGYTPQSSVAGAPGVSIDPRTIDYGSAAAGTYSGSAFTLVDVTPSIVDGQHGPYFLIIAPQAVIADGALDDFVDFKRRIGFTVEVASIESALGLPGAAKADKIRALEQDRLATYGARMQYVMLVGTSESIPVTKVYINATHANICAEDDATFKYSDWYYTDLTSNFDSNGDGCLADGIWAKAEDREPGYTPDSGIAFKPTVATGRLPFNSPATVRAVLKNSLGFEQQAEGYKRRALTAMAMLALSGWKYESGQTMPCSGNWGDKCVDPSVSGSYDLAYLAEVMKSDFLNVNLFDTTPIYEMEEAVAGGSSYTSPTQLNTASVVAELSARTHGVVNFGGHGNSTGVYRYPWSDTNGNNKVDLSTSTSTTSEIKQNSYLTTSDIAPIAADNARGSIYYMMACLTASPTTNDNLAATLLKQGHGVASIGALSVVTVGGFKQKDDGNAQTTNFYVFKKLLGRNLRLGDAFWQAMGEQIKKSNRGSGTLAMDLYGDPTLSYWGNPGGQSTRAAWSMLRQNPLGQGYLTLSGPGVPKQLWTYAGGAPSASALAPSPLVGSDGEVIVANGSYVDVLRQGALYQRLALDGPAYGTPALAADGTIYALDTAGKLYAFIHYYVTDNGQPKPLHSRYRRWAISLGAAPTTSPVIGSDGWIAVAYGSPTSTVSAVRPDGVRAYDMLIDGKAIGAIATGADRTLYVTSAVGNQGYLDRYDTFGRLDGSYVSAASTTTQAYSTPPLIAYGAVYAGRADGKVVKHNSATLGQLASFTADSAITAGPVIGPGGQIVVGTQNGTLYSLTKDLGLRWQRAIGGGAIKSMPAFSTDAVYIVHADRLRAYNPTSGAPVWSRSLGAGTGGGSVAVGYGREVYAQASNGKVVAIGEGWSDAPVAIAAANVSIGGRISLVRIDIQLSAAPAPGPGSPAPLQAPTAANGLLIQRSADGGPWVDLTILPPGTTVFSDTSVIAATAYAYRAQALDSTGADSAPTQEASLVSLPDAPNAPLLSAVTVESAETLLVEWDAPASLVDGYRVERASSAAGPWSAVAQTGGETTSVVDPGLTPATTYFYRVIALNPMAESQPSAALSGTTRQQTLAAPQTVQATLGLADEITVAWDAGPAGAQAVVEYSTFGLEGYLPLATVDAAGPFSYKPGESTAYSFRVKFVQGDNESAYTNAALSVEITPPGTSAYLPIIIR